MNCNWRLKMERRTLVPIMVFLLVAALAMPVSASRDSGIAGDDPLKDSLGQFIPGYGIIAYTISLDAYPEEIPADGLSTSTIIAQLKDRHGKDVSVEDVIVNFHSNKGTLSANSAVTDNNGRATVTLTSDTIPETANIKVSSDSVLMPGKINVKFRKVESDHKSNNKDFSGFGFNFGDRSDLNKKSGTEDVNFRKVDSNFGWNRAAFSGFGFNFGSTSNQ
jgi:hypothetical protein